MTFIQTVSGQNFNLLEPGFNDFRITDIARATSHICRFTGHLPVFYSVAQHLVLCSQIVPEEFALEALMHDAHEAYVGDVSAPLKSLLPDYKSREKDVEYFMRAAFNLPLEMSPEVHKADMILLATERRDLLGDNGTNWPCLEDITPMAKRIRPWDPQLAYDLFLARFKELTK